MSGNEGHSDVIMGYDYTRADACDMMVIYLVTVLNLRLPFFLPTTIVLRYHYL